MSITCMKMYKETKYCIGIRIFVLLKMILECCSLHKYFKNLY